MDRQLYVIEEGTKDQQVAPRTPSPHTCDGDEDRVTSMALCCSAMFPFFLFLFRLQG